MEKQHIFEFGGFMFPTKWESYTAHQGCHQSRTGSVSV